MSTYINSSNYLSYQIHYVALHIRGLAAFHWENDFFGLFSGQKVTFRSFFHLKIWITLNEPNPHRFPNFHRHQREKNIWAISPVQPLLQ